jgi:sporulation protein YlmC with PRC-barrel domain
MRVSLVLDLLDNQVVDADGVPLGRVDDLEVELPPETGTAEGVAVPQVTGIVTGSEALGHRIGGVAGRVMSSVSSRLRETGTGPPVIGVSSVRAVRPMLRLTERGPDLPEVAGLEKWLRRHLVDRHGREA